MVKPIDVLRGACALMKDFVGVRVDVECELCGFGEWDVNATIFCGDETLSFKAINPRRGDVSICILRIIVEVCKEARTLRTQGSGLMFSKMLSSPQMEAIANWIGAFLNGEIHPSEEALRIKLDML
jgi:hypothetical protein